MENEKKGIKDFIKSTNWFGVFSALVFSGVFIGATIYLAGISRELWFTITTPSAVNVCMEGYTGEHSEADKRFETKQRGEILSPVVTTAEDLKKSQDQ